MITPTYSPLNPSGTGTSAPAIYAGLHFTLNLMTRIFPSLILILSALLFSCSPSETDYKHPLPSTSQELITLLNNSSTPSLLKFDIGEGHHITFIPSDKLPLPQEHGLFMVYNDYVRMKSESKDRQFSDYEFYYFLDVKRDIFMVAEMEPIGGIIAFSPDLTEDRLRTILTAFSKRGLHKIILSDSKSW